MKKQKVTKQRVTIDQVMTWKPCGWDSDGYTKEKVSKLFRHYKYATAQLIINHPDLPINDKLWMLFHKELMNNKQLREFKDVCKKKNPHAHTNAYAYAYAYARADADARAAYAYANAYARADAYIEKWQLKQLKIILE